MGLSVLSNNLGLLPSQCAVVKQARAKLRLGQLLDRNTYAILTVTISASATGIFKTGSHSLSDAMIFCSFTLRGSSRFFTLLGMRVARLGYVSVGWLMFCAATMQYAPYALGAEIGNIRVLSYIGQPLLAEVEITALTPEDVNNLQVKLALPDVYRLGNIRRNPVLNNVRLQLRQGEQRTTVIMQSTQAIFEGYLNIYLELKDSKGQEVRALTLWLESNPENPIPEQYEVKESLPHPDGDLSESALPVPHPLIATPRYVMPKTAKTLPPALSEAELAGARLPRIKQATAPASCATQLRSLQKQVGQCELVEIENQRIAGHLDTLESKVDILKRVILAEDTAQVLPKITTPTPPPPTAPPPVTVRKNPRATVTPFPWKIIGISAAVFVAVAILAFVGLTFLNKRMAKKKKGTVVVKPSTSTATASPAGEQDPANSVNSADAADSAPSTETGAEPVAIKPMSKMAKFGQAIRARAQTLRNKLAQPFRGMKAKLSGILPALKAKLPRKKAANAENAVEPT